ncbi:MAG: ATP-binding cassette domain-containing protein [Spirochaetes bacterium]|nr:ATP-binding cassette domain-containing protein [Spirochaetota bacterium]
MIRLEHLCKTFDGGRSYAVNDVSLQVNQGETLVLLGSSGCGKTTTLKMINRLVEPTRGTVEINGTDVRDLDPVKLRRSMGYVFQGVGLFPHMTIAQNVEQVPRFLGWPPEKRNQRVREVLDLVELPTEVYGRRFPDELSGGQQQRAGVARALAADPDYLLMDEPFGALDALTREALQKEMLALKTRLKKTIIFVTHDMFEAMILGDRIAVLHEGRLEQVGTRKEIITEPKTPFVRELVSRPVRQVRFFQDVL